MAMLPNLDARDVSHRSIGGGLCASQRIELRKDGTAVDLLAGEGEGGGDLGG